MEIRTIEAHSCRTPDQKRAAAYVRVSKESVQLVHSLEAQTEHYRNLIQNNSEWIFAGIYSDGFVSGTSTAHRSGLQKLLKDCEDGEIDIILCKSISRFSRNTVDLLNICRRLKELNIDLFFEKENIAILSADGELMLSLLASFAQEESRSVSENIKWGIRKGFEEGRSTHYKLYGYSYNGKEYQIIPEEAAVIKRIYGAYLDGVSVWQMEKAFALEKIPGPKGGRFSAATIQRILQNSTYTGNTLLQKEYIENHITHKRRKNNGELAMYLVRETHPVIIPQEIYDAVQLEIEQRSACKQQDIRKVYPPSVKTVNRMQKKESEQYG